MRCHPMSRLETPQSQIQRHSRSFAMLEMVGPSISTGLVCVTQKGHGMQLYAWGSLAVE